MVRSCHRPRPRPHHRRHRSDRTLLRSGTARPRTPGPTAGDAAGPAARPRPAPAVPAVPDHPYDPRRGGCEMTAVHPSSAPPEALTRDLTGADAGSSGDGKEKAAGAKRKDRGRLSVEWVTLELMRVAYASRGGFLSRRDPRAVIIWYVICAIAPWLTYGLTVLPPLFALAAVAALSARIGPLRLGLFIVGLITQGIHVLVLARLLGGDGGALTGRVHPSLTLAAVSLVGVAAVVARDAEKLSGGVQALRVPAAGGSGVSDDCRVVPLLVTGFQTVVDGHGLRGAP